MLHMSTGSGTVQLLSLTELVSLAAGCGWRQQHCQSDQLFAQAHALAQRLWPTHEVYLRTPSHPPSPPSSSLLVPQPDSSQKVLGSLSCQLAPAADPISCRVTNSPVSSVSLLDLLSLPLPASRLILC